MNIKLIYAALILPIFLNALYGNTNNEIIIADSSSKYLIGNHIEFVKDSLSAYTIETISDPAIIWKQSKGNFINFRNTTSPYWFRFILNNKTNKNLFFEISYPLLDVIEFYRPDDKGDGYIKHLTGDTLPFNTRMIQDKNFIFKLETLNSPCMYYMKIKSNHAVTFTPIIWPDNAFSNHRDAESLNWFFYGMFSVIIIFTLTIFIATRDLTYLYLISTVLAMFFFFFSYDGYSFRYLWPNSPFWANKSVSFALACEIVFSSLFIQSLLSTKTKYPIFHKFLYSVIIPGVIFMILSIITGSAILKTFYFFITYSLLLIFLFTIIQSFRKNKMSLFLLISILPLGLFSLLSNFTGGNFISSDLINTAGLKIGAAWMSILFGLIIIDRHSVFKKLLQEKDRIVETKNQELILTNKELHKTNKKLSKTMKELKRTNQQLLLNQHEQQKMYGELIENEMRYHTLFESAGDGIMVMNGPVIIDCNEKALELFNCKRNEIIGKTHDALSPPEQPDGQSSKKNMKTKILEVYAGKKLAFHWKYMRADNTFFDVEITLTPLILGTRFNMLALIRDITDRIATQNELVLSESRLAHAQRIARLGNWEWNIAKNTMYWSDEVFKIYATVKQDSFVPSDSFIKAIHPDDKKIMLQALDDALYRQRPLNVEHRIILPDGSERIVHADAEVSFDKNNKPLLMFGTVHDITELFESKKAIEKSLAEKEVLLKEVHHRVKNNLGIIYSLLHFEKESLQGARSRELLTNIQSRIQSMALIHQKLYQSSDLNSINFVDYCRGLVNELMSLHNISENKVFVNLNIQDISLPIEKAMPCGLILNELVTNSFKYAFPKNRKGKIIIDFSYDSLYNCILSVADTGIGIPKNIDVNTASSLGMFIIKSFTEQLNGSMSLTNSNGTICTINFQLN